MIKAFRLLILCLIAVILSSGLSIALAHADLVRSDPVAGAMLDQSPAEIRAWFSQALKSGSTITVIDANFQVMNQEQATIDPTDATLLRLKLPSLPLGTYNANWRVTSIDGHISGGSFPFTVQNQSALTVQSGSNLLPIIVINLIVLIVIAGWFISRRVIAKKP